MIGPTTNGVYLCKDLGAINPQGRGMGSWVARAPRLLTSRHGVTLAIYPVCHTGAIIPPPTHNHVICEKHWLKPVFLAHIKI